MAAFTLSAGAGGGGVDAATQQAIDDNTAARHDHANKVTLDKIPATPAGAGEFHLESVNGVLQWTVKPDAKELHSGTGAPSNALGNDGDWYINEDTGEFFGPKAGGAWPATAQITAADGSLLNGTGAPAAAVGDVGDAYLDVATGNIYGPKTAAGWPAAPATNMGDKYVNKTGDTMSGPLLVPPTTGASNDASAVTKKYSDDQDALVSAEAATAQAKADANETALTALTTQVNNGAATEAANNTALLGEINANKAAVASTDAAVATNAANIAANTAAAAAATAAATAATAASHTHANKAALDQLPEAVGPIGSDEVLTHDAATGNVVYKALPAAASTADVTAATDTANDAATAAATAQTTANTAAAAATAATAAAAVNATNIASNDTDIASNATNIATNTGNITTNTADIAALQADSHTHANKATLDILPTAPTADGSFALTKAGAVWSWSAAAVAAAPDTLYSADGTLTQARTVSLSTQPLSVVGTSGATSTTTRFSAGNTQVTSANATNTASLVVAAGVGATLSGSEGADSSVVSVTNNHVELSFGGTASLRVAGSSGVTGDVLSSQGNADSPVWSKVGTANLDSALSTQINDVVPKSTGGTFSGNLAAQRDVSSGVTFSANSTLGASRLRQSGTVALRSMESTSGAVGQQLWVEVADTTEGVWAWAPYDAANKAMQYSLALHHQGAGGTRGGVTVGTKLASDDKGLGTLYARNGLYSVRLGFNNGALLEQSGTNMTLTMPSGRVITFADAGGNTTI